MKNAILKHGARSLLGGKKTTKLSVDYMELSALEVLLMTNGIIT